MVAMVCGAGLHIHGVCHTILFADFHLALMCVQIHRIEDAEQAYSRT